MVEIILGLCVCDWGRIWPIFCISDDLFGLSCSVVCGSFSFALKGACLIS